MRRMMIGLLCACTMQALFSQTDREFLRNGPAAYPLLPGYRGLHPSPAGEWPAKGTLLWSAGACSRYGIAGISTFEGNLQYSTGGWTFGITGRHSALYDIGYHRNLAAISGALRLSEDLSAGLLLLAHGNRSRELSDGSLSLGGIAGLSYAMAGKYSFRISSGFLRAMDYPENIFLLSGGVGISVSRNLLFTLEAESVSGTPLSFMASVTADLPSRIRLCVGFGTGKEIMNTGLGYKAGHVWTGASTALHPYGLRSISLGATGKYEMP